MEDAEDGGSERKSIIRFEKVCKKYPNDSIALQDISFSVMPGEIVSVVGHSGAGKTTILKMLIAEDRPSSGQVFFETADVHKLKRREVTTLRKRIGTVFQNYRLLPHKTAFENIAFAMEAAGRSNEDIKSDVPQVLDLVDLHDKLNSFPHELSGGEKQRVAIARAIINQPDLIIADEPTGNLDPVNTYEIVQILKKINDFGTTVVLTTHNKGVVESLGSRVITVDGGRIVRDDPTGRYVL
ncbi:MAG TPA: cell division ATP-binding protein FtsE [Candidatus Paceibacterota bacterium]|nr:cell division ATP-binding protein FtsE [Candidatus Paceibacterota bacterium]